MASPADNPAPGSPDKVIISNRSGMMTKYTAAGVAMIDAALSRLISADHVRGLITVVIDIDDATQLAPYGTAPIISAADESGVKRVVDAIDAAIAPDYFVLLDGPDIIPHITLLPIPGLNDGDSDIPSDLPYASAASFGSKASNFLAVTRVVGRLPMPKGKGDAAAFAGLIDSCSQQVPQPANAYQTCFAISTDPWKTSTQLTLSALFSSTNGLNISPTAGHNAIDASLVALTHVINCHGDTNDPRFYGQLGTRLPVAMHSVQVAPHVTRGAIIAAECCYGAELYDPSLAAGADPMSMAYLLGGAAAYVGSTNKAYGPFATNGQADLMVQFFVDATLKGASTGRAMLQARQRFVSTQKMADPVNLKTLAQFVLYGDPSVSPVQAVQTAEAGDAAAEAAPDAVATAKGIFTAAMTDDDERSGRRARRIGLKGVGKSLASSATHLGPVVHARGAATLRIEEIAKSRGFTGEVRVFKVGGGAAFRQAAKALDREQQLAVVSQTEEHYDETSGAKHTFVRVLVGQILGDGIVAVNEAVSR